jgi:shikimate 5-dehydrogenase
LFHNHLFTESGRQGLYIKIHLQTDQELALFLKKTTDLLPLRGISVTTPYKEKVIPHLSDLSEDAKKIQAVNTLVRQDDGTWMGVNTDGKGALTAILRHLGSVEGRHLVILGVGGAARAIALEARRQRASVSLFHPNYDTTQRVASLLDCRPLSIQDFPTTSDLLINATTSPLPLSIGHMPRCTPLMDISYSKETPSTPFLELGTRLEAPFLIQGREMFEEQALLQRSVWLKMFE